MYSRANITNYRKISLRSVLIIAFILQMFTGLGLTSYFSLQNRQKVVSDVAAQLHREIATRIEQDLQLILYSLEEY